jgi:hypothetical protein
MLVMFIKDIINLSFRSILNQNMYKYKDIFVKDIKLKNRFHVKHKYECFL